MDPENTTTDTPAKSNKVMVGSLIIILLLVIGGLYLFARNQEAVAPVVEVEEYGASDELSDSDEIENIEADLEGDFEVDIDEQGLE